MLNDSTNTAGFDTLYVSELQPESIGGYSIHQLIGRGGMGAVYLGAHADAPSQRVAIKVLPGAAFNHPRCAQRFFQEARVGASFSHPNICRVLDYGQVAADFFFVMEYLEGETLRDFILKQESYSIERAGGLALQLLEALQYLAEKQIVHRDIKPANLMVCAGDQLKILDFGLVKDLDRDETEAADFGTRAGEVMGTPAYMAPEQIQDARNVTTLTDLYAAGVVLFELMTRHSAFASEHREAFEVLDRVLTTEIQNPRELVPEMPEPLVRAILGLTAKDPDRRIDHATAVELVREGIRLAPELMLLPKSPPRSEGTEPSPISHASSQTMRARVALPASSATLPPVPMSASSRQFVGCGHAIALVLGATATLLLVAFGVWIAWPEFPLISSNTPFPVDDTRDRLTFILLTGTALIVGTATGLAGVWLIHRYQAFPRRRPAGDLVSSPPAPQLPKGVPVGVPQRLTLQVFDLRDYLPRSPAGKPHLGDYVLAEQLGDVAAVNTYVARLEAIEADGPRFVIRTLPLAVSQLAPVKLQRLLKQRAQLLKASNDCPQLNRVLMVNRQRLAVGAVSTLYYMVEDYVEETPLEQLIDGKKAVPIDVAFAALREAVHGLMALKKHGLLHNNLHPGKLFLSSQRGRLKIADMSRVCSDGESDDDQPHQDRSIADVDWLGERSRKRRPYLPMELFWNAKLPTSQSDQFSLGRIFVESLTGARLGGDAPTLEQSFMMGQADLEAEVAAVKRKSRPLGQVLETMTRLKPSLRYPRWEDLLEELDHAKVLVGGPPPLPSISPPPAGPAPAIDDAGKPTRSIRHVHESTVPRASPSMLSMAINPLNIGSNDRRRLREFVAGVAQQRGGPDLFFRNLIESVDDELLAKMPGCHPNRSALENTREFLNWCAAYGRNPRDPRYTLLGAILTAMLPELGFEHGSFIAAFISRFHLIPDDDLAETFRVSYQIPATETRDEGAATAVGPSFVWKGPDDEQLQFLLPKPPELLDVGLLQQAIQAATCVCRVHTGMTVGTGFLVAPRLVLTCRHNFLGETDEEFIQSVRDAELSFGRFSAPDGSESAGQTFRVDDEKPVVTWSPVEKLDFALLQLERRVLEAHSLRPATLLYTAPEKSGVALNILQHPHGDSMKLCLCANGVTHRDLTSGRLQYITQARAGSSGAPCFNHEWKVVAMHRSEQLRTWGSVREGVLMAAIQHSIKPYLDPKNITLG